MQSGRPLELVITTNPGVLEHFFGVPLFWAPRGVLPVLHLSHVSRVMLPTLIYLIPGGPAYGEHIFAGIPKTYEKHGTARHCMSNESKG